MKEDRNMTVLKKAPKPCCKKFEDFSRNYVDLVVQDDEMLELLISFISRVDDNDPMESVELRRLAIPLREYLARKKIRESYFFGRSLIGSGIDSADVGAEVMRAHGKFNREITDRVWGSKG